MSARLPDFVVIGAMKAGTTTLFRHLQSHPQVFMPELKEPDFFVKEKNWSKGFDWYTALFADAPPDALVGEGSTNYSKAASFPESPVLLHEYVPGAKIIYILRDPIERIRSQYAHSILSGGERRRPAEAITPSSGYVDTSLYGAQLRRYLDLFPLDQVLVLTMEDMRDDPAGLLDKVEDFLGLERYQFRTIERRDNASSERRANTRFATWLKRNERLTSWGRRLPPQLRDRAQRVVTRESATRDVSVPGEVLAPLHGLLAADRALLQAQYEIVLDKWTQLS